MKSVFIFTALSVIFALGGTASAQKAWEKPTERMSREDAKKVLTDSPFAKTYQSEAGGSAADAITIAREQGQSVNRGGSNPRSVPRYLGPAPIVVRLHSAVPVRRALVRMRQLDSGYEDMGSADRQRFDDSQKSFLDCSICRDYYVVSLIKFKDTTPGAIDEGILQRLTLADLKGNIWLQNDSGAKLEIFQFTPPKGGGDAAYLFFKRTDANGTPFLTTDMKQLKVVFSNDFLDARNPYAIYLPRNFEFNLEKMKIDGKLEF